MLILKLLLLPIYLPLVILWVIIKFVGKILFINDSYYVNILVNQNAYCN